MEKTNEVKLNLACGNDYREGYINIDNGSMGDFRVDMYNDVKELAWNQNSVDKILVSHFLMYVKHTEIMELLKRWHSWLKKDGVLIIEQPDIKKLAQILVNETNPIIIDDWALTNIFGHYGEPAHIWGYYPEGMAMSLYKAGFSQCAYDEGTKKPNRDFMIIATK